ncbi:hypothetical protein [Rubritalea tangerina]|uniref:hypothetical protein n=1 Tax=Rubritalea tangerina TaxID=430798 RepID=UPI00362016FB
MVVASGAPEHAKRSEMEVTPAIEKALATLLTPEQRAKMEKAQKEELAAKKKHGEMKLKTLTPKMAEVNASTQGH